MFEKPETFEGLDLDALRALSAEAMTEAQGIMASEDADLTDEQIARVESLMAASAEIDSEVSARETADAERAAKIAALREQTAPADSTPTTDEPEGDEDDGEDEAPEGDEPVEAETRKEVVVAAAPAPKPTPRRTVAVAQKNAPDVEPSGRDDMAVTITAAANVAGYNSDSELAGMAETALAFMSRAKNFKSIGNGPGDRFERYGVARITKPVNEFNLEGLSTAEAMERITEASKESRLPGGSLVAAGGWCAPSEQIYGFCDLETVDGILSIPEMTWARGGISFTKGPDYATLAATWGFLQTEAQAEAGTVKVCYPVACPPWEEVRLDAIGFCVTAGILTNAAFPELINRVLQIGAVAHAHKVNASVISRISTYLGAAVNYAEIGGATADVLGALELQAEVLRYRYALAINSSLEVVLPVWARGIIRGDLSRRTGVDLLAVSDAQIQSYFAARNLAVQWVYDYQPLNTAAGQATAYPTTLEAMIYPAGAFVKGTTDVIDLDAVYDSTGLSTNTYTAAFFEEGLAVANTCGGGIKVSIDISCLAGVTGAAELTCA